MSRELSRSLERHAWVIGRDNCRTYNPVYGLVVGFDTVVAVAIGVWVLPRTWQLMRESLGILMEGVPGGLNIKEIESTILRVDGVTDVHDLHVWAVSSGRNVLTSHVVVRDSVDRDAALADVINAVSHAFDIHHCTIQMENTDFHKDTPIPPH